MYGYGDPRYPEHGYAPQAQPPSAANVVYQGMRYPVTPHGLRVGREPSNGLFIPDPSVSRQHLVIWSTDQGVFARDQGSQNGTFVNGQRLAAQQAVQLGHGDRVRVGPVELLIEIVAEPAAGLSPEATMRPASSSSLLPALLAAALVLAGGGLVYGLLSGKIGGSSEQTTSTRSATATATATVSPTVAASPKPGLPGKPAGGALAGLPNLFPSPTVPPTPTTAPTATPVPSPTPAIAPGRNRGVERALAGAVVQVIVPIGTTGQASVGSGSLITSNGHILTNAHVVTDSRRGTVLNNGEAVIAIPPSESAAAKPTFRAQVVEILKDRDLALLKINANLDRSPLKGPIPIEPLAVGRSEAVRIDDPLIIVGYPGLGGDSITVTRGIVSGVDQERGFWKTDSEVSPGNSGGAALNQAGELIGVPTAGIVSAETVSKISLVRPIQFAKPLIDKALADR